MYHVIRAFSREFGGEVHLRNPHCQGIDDLFLFVTEPYGTVVSGVFPGCVDVEIPLGFEFVLGRMAPAVVLLREVHKHKVGIFRFILQGVNLRIS